MDYFLYYYEWKNYEMKTIVLVAPPVLPIPAIRGGAIESLITQFIDVNEKKQRARIIVFSPLDENARKIQLQYKNTIFFNFEVKKRKIHQKIKTVLLSQTRKYTNLPLIVEDYYKYVYKVCCSLEFDFIVAEGGSYSEFKKFSRKFGSDKIYLHIHHNLLCNKEIDNIFGGTISVSNYVNQKWIESCHGSVFANEQKNFIVYNGVDISVFNKSISTTERHELREKFKIKDDDFLLIYVGRIVEVKGVEELVDAVLRINNDSIKLLMIGNVGFKNISESRFSKKIESKCSLAPDRIIRIDYVDNNELYTYYQTSDLQVVPSKWEEAFGLVAVEAGLCKLPSLITNSGGLQEIVDRRTTLIIKKDDKLENNLIEAISLLAENKTKYSELKNNFDNYYHKFSKENFYDNLINVFEE